MSREKTILYISHDRELLNNTATRVVTVELASGGHGVGNSVWTHPGGFMSYHEARTDRFLRFEELRRRWDEEHAKIKALVLRLKIKAEYNDGMASQYHAAQTRLRKFEEAGPPTEQPREQQVLHAAQGRADRQARGGLHRPRAHRADEAVRPRGLVRRAGGRAGLQRVRQVALPAAAGGRRQRPGRRAPPGAEVPVEPVAHTGKAKLGARVRPGWFVQTHEHPELIGRTLLEVLHRGDGTPDGRQGMGREQAARVLDRYELAHASEQRFESLSGGQQARFQILLLELSGATLLVLDEPTDNLDVQSAEALEAGLEAFEGTVVAVTHDRWFARGFDRFLVYGADGEVYEIAGTGLGRGPGGTLPVSALEIDEVDPSDPASFEPFYEVYAAALRHGPQGEFATVWQLDEIRVSMEDPDERDLPGRLGGPHGDRVVATGWLQGSTVDNTDLADVLVCCTPSRPRPRVRRPDARPRRGAGPRARSDPAGRRGELALRPGRRGCRLEPSWPGPGGQGFELGLVDVQRRLAAARPAELLDELAAEAAAHHEGYRLRSFTGPVPDDLAEGWVALDASLMTEAPMGDIEREAETADVGALRADEA